MHLKDFEVQETELNETLMSRVDEHKELEDKVCCQPVKHTLTSVQPLSLSRIQHNASDATLHPLRRLRRLRCIKLR